MLILLSVFAGRLFAQKKKFKKNETIQLNDSLTSYSQSGFFDFPNVNKVRFYYDASALKHIKQLETSNRASEMYSALREYVGKFGIDNFSKNVPMIWRLAQLSEKYGQKGEAILLYKLALKHHRQGIDISQLYKKYDSAETDKKKYYVPLQDYYELVNYRKEIDTLRPPHSVLTSMGDRINSDKEDYGPAIGNVDYILLFTSKRNKHKQRAYDEDIFYSSKIDGEWTQAEGFKTINTPYNEGSACLSLDGKYLYFSRCNAPGTLGSCDLYVASLNNDSVWSDVKNLGTNVNSTGWESHPSVSHSGDTLFFASNRAGGFGLSDIYFSVKDKKGNWSPAKNLGPIVNTVKSEVSPFFHHTFNVLYFSSDGHPLNFGDFDIYKSYQQKNGWGEPQNIGPLVNGAGSEYYFTIDSKSHDLYYARSSQDDIKNLDLFSFPVPMEAHPEAVVNFSGIVLDQNGKPILKGIVSIIDLDQGVEIAPKFLREDGTYDFQLINKRNYLLIIQGDDFFRIEQLFYMDGHVKKTITAEPIESKIAFKSLEFENGKADILKEMHSDLAKLGNFLIDHPNEKLKIAGHTDSSGDEQLNLKLSQDRADAIKNYLIKEFKLEDVRIEAVGYGSAKPLVEEKTEEDRQLNRRVEFELARFR
ncbi:MAG: Outer membrane lipoprotein omp16 precursor [Cytophagales bacterium]|jgi:outer membrane protein OmpA-like peptidoglycan-associated protein|nr:MAG: Outer membrane lipoprotein omp16 precursor [Cytophagales bacterium]